MFFWWRIYGCFEAINLLLKKSRKLKIIKVIKKFKTIYKDEKKYNI